ncbi:MAG TPA: hypothetical protein VF532_24625 [Candidatus Angelobacter sp.]
METELSEKEEAAEMQPFTAADWKQEFPDYSAEELEEKLPERTRASWMAPVASCLFGTLLAAAIAGVKVNDLPRLQQVRGLFIFLLVLAPLFSSIWYWLFFARPKCVAEKTKEWEQANSAGSEPIHPK